MCANSVITFSYTVFFFLDTLAFTKLISVITLTSSHEFRGSEFLSTKGLRAEGTDERRHYAHPVCGVLLTLRLPHDSFASPLIALKAV